MLWQQLTCDTFNLSLTEKTKLKGLLVRQSEDSK